MAHTLERMIALGTTRVRTYAQVDVDCKLERFDAVAAARDTHSTRADVQIMVFPQAGILREEGTESYLEAALAAGGNVIGGIDPCQLDRDPAQHLDIAMTTIAPSTSDHLSLEALVEAGVRIGLGQDGQRDYWSPYGNCDMLDRTWQLAFTNNYRRDDLIEMSLAVATMGGASIMDHEVPRLCGISDRPGLAPGDRADLLLVDGETPTSAVMDRGTDRTVIHDGTIVAEGLSLT